DTVAEIARQKAGIIVSGCPTVMAPQRESAAEVIREVAKEKGSELTEVALACNLRLEAAATDNQVFRLRTPTAGYLIKMPLIDKHQLDNAATAIFAVEKLALVPSLLRGERVRVRGVGQGPPEDAPGPIKLDEAAVKAGFADLKWPGRIEII